MTGDDATGGTFNFDLNAYTSPLDGCLGVEAAHHVSAAIEAINAPGGLTTRKAAIAALEAARAIIEQFASAGVAVLPPPECPPAETALRAHDERGSGVVPISEGCALDEGLPLPVGEWRGDYYDAEAVKAYAAINLALGAIQVELSDLEAGGSAGRITAVLSAKGNRPSGLRQIEREARAVLAVQWLALPKVGFDGSQKAAVALVADAYDVKRVDVDRWVDTFSRPASTRRRKVLNDMWFELDEAWDFNLGAAKPDDIISWLTRRLAPANQP